MDTAHWPQSMEGIEGGVKLGQNGGGDHHQQPQKKAKPQEQLNCPRCNSTNTKFCYYNNYSLTQPRYFCKTCRRYWTEGGSLRKVPVGGGSRKNKKSISSSTATATTTTTTTSSSSSILSKLNGNNNSNSNHHHDRDLINPSSVLLVPNLSQFSFQNSKIMDESGASQDLNLAFQYVHHHAPKMELDHMNINQQSGGMTSSLSALELLRSGMASRGLNNSFIPNLMPDSSITTTTTTSTSTSAIFSSPGFSLDFHHHGLNGSSRYHHEMQESNPGVHHRNGKILFPSAEAKQQINPNISSSSDQAAAHQNNRGSHEGGANSNGYWTGLLGGSGSW